MSEDPSWKNFVWWFFCATIKVNCGDQFSSRNLQAWEGKEHWVSLQDQKKIQSLISKSKKCCWEGKPQLSDRAPCLEPGWTVTHWHHPYKIKKPTLLQKPTAKFSIIIMFTKRKLDVTSMSRKISVIGGDMMCPWANNGKKNCSIVQHILQVKLS